MTHTYLNTLDDPNTIHTCGVVTSNLLQNTSTSGVGQGTLTVAEDPFAECAEYATVADTGDGRTIVFMGNSSRVSNRSYNSINDDQVDADGEAKAVTNNRKRQRLGIILGIVSGFTWGLDGVLLGEASKHMPENIATGTLYDTLGSNLVTPAIHDTVSFILAAIYTIIVQWNSDQTLWNYFRSRKQYRSITWIALASMCGGPIGISAYSLAITYIGAGYTAAISALYPGIGSLLAHVLLHDRILLVGWVGITLCILGSIPTSIVATSNDITKGSVIGILFAFLSAVGWGVECVIANHAFTKFNIHPTVAFCLRQMISALTYNCIIIPSFYRVSYSVLQHITLKYLLYTLSSSLCGTISYICYYNAIEYLGSIQAVGLNITYVAWATLLSLFFGSTSYLGILLPCALIIAMGSFMCSGLGKDPHPLRTIRSWF
uniref:Protein licB n=2 Tax=Lygus hesperus TaxID=30085 RepID=A0A0A9X4N3_LYGHE